VNASALIKLLWAGQPALAAARHHPFYGPSDFQFRNPKHRELFLSGLRLAAGETT
jgi:hypothetical protein